MRLSAQFLVCLFISLFIFWEKFLSEKKASKHTHTQKEKISLLEVLCAKNCCFYCLAFACFCFVSCFLFVLWFCVAKTFSHKLNKEINKQTKNCPDNPLTHLWKINFYQVFFCLHLIILICMHLFYLFEPIFIYMHLFLSVRIFSYWWSFVIFFFPLWSSVKIAFIHGNIWLER